jgi:hypothetical protein
VRVLEERLRWQKLQNATMRQRARSPPPPEEQSIPRKMPLPQTELKPFTFSSDSRAEARAAQAEAQRKAEEEAKVRKVLSMLTKHASGGLLNLKRMSTARSPFGLTPELKKAWQAERDRVVGEAAALRLQTIFRGRLARRAMEAKRGGMDGRGGASLGGVLMGNDTGGDGAPGTTRRWLDMDDGASSQAD